MAAFMANFLVILEFFGVEQFFAVRTLDPQTIRDIFHRVGRGFAVFGLALRFDAPGEFRGPGLPKAGPQTVRPHPKGRQNSDLGR